MLPAWLRAAAPTPPLVRVGEHSLPLVIRRLPQARRMTLRLAPSGDRVQVSMPRWGREAEALAFARARADWLAAELARRPGRAAPVPGGRLAYRGTAYTIDHHPTYPRLPVREGAVIRCGGPMEGLEARLRRWLIAEARPLFAADLADYARRAGVAEPRLALSTARARWGSCSSRGGVRLNWRLVMAPDAPRRAVVAHEVAHLIHFDHSPRFHALLAELYEGDLAAANRWLKAEGRGLYAPFG